MEHQEIYKKALELFQSKDAVEAQRFIDEHFGQGANLNIVKCDQCGEILAFVVNILAKGLTGGDDLTNLAIYKHIREHPDHAADIYGESHGMRLPLGKTLFYGVVTNTTQAGALFKIFGKVPSYKLRGLIGAAEHHGITLEEALDKRIAYLEAKQ